ncbi:MAG TPA: glycosyltransferase family 4 protein, partial [Terrimicrobiaceae bacterium]
NSTPVVFLDQSGQLGGAELFLADLAEECSAWSRVLLLEDGPFVELLRERGAVVECISLPPEAKALSKSAGMLSLLKVGPQLLAFYREVRKRLEDAKLIYCNTPKAIVLGGLVAWLSRRNLVVHLHDLLTAEHFSPMNLKLLQFFSRRAGLVIANSKATADTFVATGGKASVVEVVYNGFEPSDFARPDDFSQALLRKRLGLPDRTIIGIFGRLTRWKGQHIALEALRSLPGVHLAIVGEALFTEDDRAYRDELRRTAEEPGLQGRVHFLGFQSDVISLLQAMDVVVHCSVAAEPFGRVIVEAMLARTPVVATRGGGVDEIITDGVDGFLVTPADPVALALAVGKIIQEPTLASKLASAALESASERFCMEKTVGQIRQLLKDVVNIK